MVVSNMQYQRRPIVVEAFQHFGDMGTHTAVFPQWIIEACTRGIIYATGKDSMLKTVDGNIKLNDGDWIVRGPKGHLWPFSPEDFAANYDQVDTRNPDCITPFQEPKYTIVDGKLTNRQSGSVIPDDEPVFILRARDVLALPTLQYYRRSAHGEHHDAVSLRIKQFSQFATNHPERMKIPDTTITDDWNNLYVPGIIPDSSTPTGAGQS